MHGPSKPGERTEICECDAPRERAAVSVLVVKGDIFHAVSAWRDADIAFTCAADTIRYHGHFVNEGYSLSDGIQRLPDFKPRFLDLPSANQDSLNTVLGAVCGESSALIEACTKAPSASRRSNEPEL